MAEIKVLIEGYARKLENGWAASSSCTLIRNGGKNLIVDPGCNRGKLIEALKKENLAPADIDFVLLTHTHIDHCLLVGIFENAKVYTDREIYNGDEQLEHDNKIPEMDLEIVQTPGHDQFHCSAVVNDSKLGKVVIAGDLFWWMDDEEQKTDYRSLMDHKDPYVKNEKVLSESRKKVLEIADYIIPGHGKMFKVEK